jgi:hypothetical protein
MPPRQGSLVIPSQKHTEYGQRTNRPRPINTEERMPVVYLSRKHPASERESQDEDEEEEEDGKVCEHAPPPHLKK